MKELAQIINQLHALNEQIVEKDNMIDHMQVIVALLTQMLADPILVRSDAYLDLKAKYLNTIDEKLKKIDQMTVEIEPENLTKMDPTKSKVRQFTKEDVNAPIRTDIFQAPSCRRTYKIGKKKSDASEDQSVATNGTVTNEAYFSFDHQGETYYINTVDKNQQNTFDIIDNQHRIKGHLKGSIVTLLSEDSDNKGSFKTEKIELKIVTTQDNRPTLFGQYLLNCV